MNAKKLAKVKLCCHLNIAVHLYIAKYSKIAKCILESVKLGKIDRALNGQKRYTKVFSGSFFFATRPSLVMQAPPL